MLVLAAPAAAAAPANVTVRIEGGARTLLEQSAVRTTATAVNKSGQAGQECSGTSAAGALEVATNGDWGGPWFNGLGYGVERIFTESHPFNDPNGDFWAEWVNNRSGQGLCADELQEGDELVFFVDRCQYDTVAQRCSNEPVLPLELSLPAAATAGTPVTATVVKHKADGSPTAPGETLIAGALLRAPTPRPRRAAARLRPPARCAPSGGLLVAFALAGRGPPA